MAQVRGECQAGSCEHDNQLSDSLKCGEYLNKQNTSRISPVIAY
jgi:hypothetical protein